MCHSLTQGTEHPTCILSGHPVHPLPGHCQHCCRLRLLLWRHSPSLPEAHCLLPLEGGGAVPAPAGALSVQDASDLAGSGSSHSQALSAGRSERCLPGHSCYLLLLQRPPLSCLQRLLPPLRHSSQAAAWNVPLLGPLGAAQSPRSRMPDSAHLPGCLPRRCCCLWRPSRLETLPTVSSALQANVWGLPLLDLSGWEGSPCCHVAACGHPPRCPPGVCRSTRPSVQ